MSEAIAVIAIIYGAVNVRQLTSKHARKIIEESLKTVSVTVSGNKMPPATKSHSFPLLKYVCHATYLMIFFQAASISGVNKGLICVYISVVSALFKQKIASFRVDIEGF